MTMTARAKLSAKFQISIPKEVRDALAWRAGQEFIFIPKGTGVIVMPAPELDDIIGLARGVKDRNFRDRKDRF
jgi:AbrB family looped-hinge helix DNA binding protein